MLDNHKVFEDEDPIHSLKLLGRTWPSKGKGKSVLEPGAGIGRVSETVLCKYFAHIDILEPSENMRTRAVERMNKAKHPYRNVFDCTIADFKPLPRVKYDAVWLQFVTMYLSDQ